MHLYTNHACIFTCNGQRDGKDEWGMQTFLPKHARSADWHIALTSPVLRQFNYKLQKLYHLIFVTDIRTHGLSLCNPLHMTKKGQEWIQIEWSYSYHQPLLCVLTQQIPTMSHLCITIICCYTLYVDIQFSLMTNVCHVCAWVQASLPNCLKHSPSSISWFSYHRSKHHHTQFLLLPKDDFHA